jgi:hypothetical protein
MGQGRRTAHKLLGTVLVAAATAMAGLSVGAGTAAAAPVTLPTPVQQQAARLHAADHLAPTQTGAREALRLGASGTDDDTYLEVDPGCVSKAGGKARPNATVGSSTKLKLDYVLTGPGDHRKTGTVKVKAAKDNPLGLSAVKPGAYRLTLARHGSTTLVADETFDVLPCVQAKASCHAVTFTNPAGNPSAYVMYGGHKKNQSFDLDVAPGTSRTVRADYSTIDYRAFGFYDSIDRAAARLGEDDVSVKQHCSTPPAQPGSNAVQSTGEIGCQDGDPAYVDVAWSVQPSVKKVRYELVDASGTTVRSGTLSGGKHKSFSLLAGTYHYRSYVKGGAAPFEDVSFTVLNCVQVTPVCRGIEVRNPNPVALDVYVFGYDEDDESDEGTSVDATAAPSATTRVAWDRTTAYVLVTATDEDTGSHFYSDSLTPDLGSGDVDLQVPQNC